MPWWAVAYLTIFVIFSIAGIFDDLDRPNKIRYISGEIITAIFVFTFITGYYYEDIGDVLGMYVFPMLIVGVAHELFSAKRTLQDESKNPEYTERELFYLNNIGLLLANLLIVPGYVFGLMVGLRNTGL
jgi:hypothetical protein